MRDVSRKPLYATLSGLPYWTLSLSIWPTACFVFSNCNNEIVSYSIGISWHWYSWENLLVIKNKFSRGVNIFIRMWCLTRTSHRKQLVILTTIISTSSQQKLSAGCLQTKWLWVRVQLQSLKGIYMIAGKHFTCMLKVVSKFSNSMFQPCANCAIFIFSWSSRCMSTYLCTGCACCFSFL